MHPLRVGDTAPDFSLANPFEVCVSLESVIAAGAAVVEFIRGTWDPNARDRVEELAALRNAFRERNARSLIVTCERAETARTFVEQRTTPVTLLLDPTRETAQLYGVYQRFSFGAIHVARPATYILDRCAFVRWSHVGRSPIDTASVTDILAALDDIARERRSLE